MLYIPGTQGRLFRNELDDFVRNSNGKKLKFVVSPENREGLLKEKDLKEIIFVDYHSNGLEEYKIEKPVIELYYPNSKRYYLVEEE